MVRVDKCKFKVVNFEIGNYNYDTVFIEANKKVIQIPVKKDATKDKQLVGKTILIPCEVIGDDYLFNKEINKVEFDEVKIK